MSFSGLMERLINHHHELYMNFHPGSELFLAQKSNMMLQVRFVSTASLKEQVPRKVGLECFNQQKQRQKTQHPAGERQLFTCAKLNGKCYRRNHKCAARMGQYADNYANH